MSSELIQRVASDSVIDIDLTIIIYYSHIEYPVAENKYIDVYILPILLLTYTI